MAGIVLEDNCHLLLRIPVSVLRQTSRPTKNPILTSIIQLGPSNVDYGLGANPNPAREGLFRKEEFRYEAQNDVYICPGNQQLHPRYRSTGGEPDQPWNSDEPQHLHVVWAWANGMLPYKDVFDNHSPLFQAISAPLFALLGKRADIVGQWCR